MDNDYKKYIKYKLKYLTLKQKGSGIPNYNKINDTTYVMAKEMTYKEASYPRDKKTGIDTVIFVFEKLTDDNYLKWQYFASNHRNNTSRMGAVGDNKFVTVVDGISSFNTSLELFITCSDKYDIWIAYAVKGISKLNDEHDMMTIKHDNIEMAESVFADNESYVTTHMGIFRNYIHFVASSNPHIGLSLMLHSFAAFMSKVIYPNVQYMITNPAFKMKEIMMANFQKGEIWIGATKERLQKHKFIENNNHNKHILEQYKNKKNELTADNYKHLFKLYAHVVDRLNNEYDETKTKSEQFINYLQTHTCNELIDAVENHLIELNKKLYDEYLDSTDLTDDDEVHASDYAVQHDELTTSIINIYKNNKELPDNEIKEKILKFITDYNNDFVYNFLNKDIAGTSSFINNEYYKTDKHYFSDDLSDDPPAPIYVNNNNDWFVMIDDKFQQFATPKWLLSADCKHTDLLNHLDTVIINIPSLIKKLN